MIINFLRTLLPDYWLMNTQFSKELNDFCIRSLNDGHEFEDVQSYTAKFNGVRLWIKNHPYGSFTIYDDGDTIYARPSRVTIFRLKKRLDCSSGNVSDVAQYLERKEQS